MQKKWNTIEAIQTYTAYFSYPNNFACFYRTLNELVIAVQANIQFSCHFCSYFLFLITFIYISFLWVQRMERALSYILSSHSYVYVWHVFESSGLSPQIETSLRWKIPLHFDESICNWLISVSHTPRLKREKEKREKMYLNADLMFENAVVFFIA